MIKEEHVSTIRRAFWLSTWTEAHLNVKMALFLLSWVNFLSLSLPLIRAKLHEGDEQTEEQSTRLPEVDEETED